MDAIKIIQGKSKILTRTLSLSLFPWCSPLSLQHYFYGVHLFHFSIISMVYTSSTPVLFPWCTPLPLQHHFHGVHLFHCDHYAEVYRCTMPCPVARLAWHLCGSLMIRCSCVTKIHCNLVKDCPLFLCLCY